MIDVLKIGIDVGETGGGIAEQIAVGIARPQSSACQEINAEPCRLRFGWPL